MPVIRTPIKRQPQHRITPKALALFRQMLKVEGQKCTCKIVVKGANDRFNADGTVTKGKPIPGETLTRWSKFDCPKCAAWWGLQRALRVEFKTPLWQIYAVEKPDAEPVTPAERLYVQLKSLVAEKGHAPAA